MVKILAPFLGARLWRLAGKSLLPDGKRGRCAERTSTRSLLSKNRQRAGRADSQPEGDHEPVPKFYEGRTYSLPPWGNGCDPVFEPRRCSILLVSFGYLVFGVLEW